MNDMLKDSGWARRHDWHARVMAPLSSWICDAIGCASGMKVLDTACGTGIPGLSIAERIRPDGELVAIDVAPSMIAAMRDNARAAGLSNVNARVMSLAALDFADGTFDAVVCKDGLMYAPDAVEAARGLHRVLAPGGRVAVTAWDAAPRATFFRVMFAPLAAFVSMPADPRGPVPLRLSPPGVLEGVLRDAGFVDVAVESREVVFEFDSFAHYWDVIRDMAAPVEAAVANLPPAKVAALEAAFADALAPFTSKDGRIRLPTSSLCARGRRA